MGFQSAQTDKPFAVLASGFGEADTGGGLFALLDGQIERIDHLSGTGLWVGGGSLLRLLRATEPDCPGEILVYDRKGVARYYRVDGLTDPHDILRDGDHYVAVSTLTNSILWISDRGEIVKCWKAPGDGDAWHLNSLLRLNGELYCSAFGSFERHREWCDHADEPTGFLWNLDRSALVVGGLSHPHHPRFFDGAWAVCNSMTRELLQIDPDSGSVRRRVKLNGYTRGFAVSGHWLFVGESANRKDPEAARTASIAILSRSDWRLVDRICLPCREVYDLQILDKPDLMEGLRRGFRTNPTRVAEQDQYTLFRQAGVEPELLWAVSDPLPAAACRVRIEAELPQVMEAGSVVVIDCDYESHSGAVLTSAPPYPVHIATYWRDPVSAQRTPGVEELRTVLPRALPPGQRHSCKVRIAVPPAPGEYVLRVTFVQEQVAWFDGLDPSNACEALVRVLPSSKAGKP